MKIKAKYKGATGRPRIGDINTARLENGSTYCLDIGMRMAIVNEHMVAFLPEVIGPRELAQPGIKPATLEVEEVILVKAEDGTPLATYPTLKKFLNAWQVIGG